MVMISLRCTHCRKDLKAKDELAGKKVQCPGCGTVVAVPQSAAATLTSPVKPRSANLEEQKTLPPRAVSLAEECTLPPKNRGEAEKESLSDSGGLTGLAAERKGEGTQSLAPGPNAEWTDFLAPPEGPDELGRLGGFRILKILGHGGMGVVFQAEDSKLGRKVAIKAMLPHLTQSQSAYERFLREARAAAALEHDHIVPILQVGEDRGVPFIVMPFLQGEPLDERLKGAKILPVAEVLRIGREAAEGLAAAHKRGLIHRDIKPANLWLQGEKARVKILDFGLARAVADATHLTQTGAIIGTPAYMAPEQAGGKAVDHRCDLFSLGCVLYRMCTGEMPFKGSDTLAIIAALALDNPPPPLSLNGELPAELSDLVMQLLAKQPEDRPESASKVVKALQELEEHGADKTVQPSAKQRSTRKRRTEKTGSKPKPVASRKKWPLLAGAGMLGMLALLWFFLLRPSNNQPSRERERPENKGPEKEFTNSLRMKFVLIPAGKFTMGSSPEEIERCIKSDAQHTGFYKTEGPQHEVEITQPFYLGVHEVTVGQVRKFVKDNKYLVGDDRWLKPGFEQTDDHPVIFVTWQNTVDFCLCLSEKEGKKYRLPTESEWEYGCRAGKGGNRYCFGNDDSDVGLYAWHNSNSGKKTHPVGKLKENDWGLFDMHGNAWEWCQDNYDGNYYKTSPKQNPPGPSGGERVIRGGSWFNVPAHCRSAFRNHNDPGSRHNNLSFRVVLVVSSPGGVRA
jgi:formylglycine-generating enzyme required for sulfatase activity